MKTYIKNISAITFALVSFGAAAEVKVDFDNPASYKSIGVYDVWENSPFRNGELTGNFAIAGNPDTSVNDMTGLPFNESGSVLAAQRSRFGSNRFGVRVDLNEPWEIKPQTQYVHVLVRKPKTGRVMLVGLGSRKERHGQNPYTEQFWELSINNVGTDQWYDAVFPVKGADGVEIRSLVLVPDCESPHNLDEDFIFYVDDIDINSSPLSRIATEYYPIAGNKTTTKTAASNKYATSIGLDIAGRERQEIPVDQKDNGLLYQDLTSSVVFAKPGDTLLPFISYNGNWMHSYCFIDYDNDGAFRAAITDGATPAGGSEIVSYNYYDGKDSHGREVKNPGLIDNVGVMPSFTLPKNLKPGAYRMRYKVDWNNSDPMGNMASDNKITDNGGMIADVMLLVYDNFSEVNDHQLNGEVVRADGTKLNSLKVQSDEPLTVKSVPEKGFHNGGITVKAGYNIDKDEAVDKYGNPQYSTITIPADAFSADGIYTLPAELIRGNILIEGIMNENGK